MHALRHLLFGTATRRWGALLLSDALFFGGAPLIHRYIDLEARSPGLAFTLFALWMALGIIAALCTLIGLGPLLFGARFIHQLLKDEMAALDARIDGRAEVEADEDDEEAAIQSLRRDHSARFGIYFIGFAALFVITSDQLSGGFMSRFTHPGVAIVHMRSPQPATRRTGLEMLTTRLDFHPSDEVSRVVLAALDDPDEGVAARAAFAAGGLGLDATAPRLAQMARQQPALSFAAMIALGRVGRRLDDSIKPEVQRVARGLADAQGAQAEPRALAIMLGMLRAPEIQRLRAIFEGAPSSEARVAALWALGELRDAQLFEIMTTALRDPDLQVRCAGAVGLEKMIIFEASVPLQAAFEAVKDPAARCEEVRVPVQEGGPKIVMLTQRLYHINLLRAMATTDDPKLMDWLVAHQEGVAAETHDLMRKLYERLKKKDARGELNRLKQKDQIRALRRVEGDDAKVKAAE
ncbi:hypothetical protein KKF91_00245 [Myxococcota bacterium]|nr:hypothetical protein [Myxococcota bacterium]MBU1428964.1 hypothetical protein [Myxococcota bacterium]MBU1899450.1 hypothetical protein [Myxococcota bacterium]